MQQVLMVFQVILSILLSLAILLQQRGSGLSATFGGQGGFIASKRGAEKFLSNATIVLSILFIANAATFLFL